MSAPCAAGTADAAFAARGAGGWLMFHQLLHQGYLWYGRRHINKFEVCVLPCRKRVLFRTSDITFHLYYCATYATFRLIYMIKYTPWLYWLHNHHSAVSYPMGHNLTEGRCCPWTPPPVDCFCLNRLGPERARYQYPGFSLSAGLQQDYLSPYQLIIVFCTPAVVSAPLLR